jgi:hypothetical protein
VDGQPDRDWKREHLDKDFLIEGNKHYSPTTCVFLGGGVNGFINSRDAARGKYMLGVTKGKNKTLHGASCKDPLKRKGAFLGSFETELEAHFAWKSKKHRYALELAELEEDPRVKEVLRNKYK